MQLNTLLKPTGLATLLIVLSGVVRIQVKRWIYKLWWKNCAVNLMI